MLVPGTLKRGTAVAYLQLHRELLELTHCWRSRSAAKGKLNSPKLPLAARKNFSAGLSSKRRTHERLDRRKACQARSKCSHYLVWSPDPAGVFLNHWGGGGTGKGVGEFRYVYDQAVDAVATGRMRIDLCLET
jgi:hypothetical protein